MKAQRRHDLQENELAKVIKGAPTFWQQSGGKLLALLIAVLVIVLLVRFRISSNRQAHAQAIQGLSAARAMIVELESTGRGQMSMFAPPQESSAQRKQYFNEAGNLLSEVTRLTDDRTLTAEALLARGDLNWTAATLPDVAGAATQPALQVNRKELIDNAAEAYRTVADGYAENKSAALAARFSLAAVAEQRGEWDAAKSIYEKLATETKDQPAYQQLAVDRQRILEQLRNPVIFATPTTQPVIPPLVAAPTTATTAAATQASANAATIASAATQPIAPSATAASATAAPATTNATTQKAQ